MAKLIFVPALAMGLGALYYISRHRHHNEVQQEKTLYPHQQPGGDTMIEAGIE